MTLETIPDFVLSAIRIHCAKAIDNLFSYAESNPQPELLSGLCTAVGKLDVHTDDSEALKIQKDFTEKLNKLLIETSIYTIEKRNCGRLSFDYIKYVLQLQGLVVKSEYDLISTVVYLVRASISQKLIDDLIETTKTVIEAGENNEDTKAALENPVGVLQKAKLEEISRFLNFSEANGVYEFEAYEYYKANKNSSCDIKRVYAGFRDGEIDENIRELIKIENFNITVILENYEKNSGAYKSFFERVKEKTSLVPYSIRFDFRQYRHVNKDEIKDVLQYIKEVECETAICFDYRTPTSIKQSEQAPNRSEIDPPKDEDIADIIEIIKSPLCLVELNLRGFDFTESFANISKAIVQLENINKLEIARIYYIIL